MNNIGIYFFDSSVAFRVASEDNLKYTCFYDGENLKNAPDNCINVPISSVYDFFKTTIHPQISELNFDNIHFSDDVKAQISQNITQILIKIKNEKIETLNLLLEKDVNEKNLNLMISTFLKYFIEHKELNKNIIAKLLVIINYLNENRYILDTTIVDLSTSLLKTIIPQHSIFYIHLQYILKILQNKTSQHILQVEYFELLARYRNLTETTDNFQLIKILYPANKFENYIDGFSKQLFGDDFFELDILEQKENIYKLYYISNLNYERGVKYKNIFHILHKVYTTALRRELDELVFFLYTPLLYSWNGIAQTQDELKFFNDTIERPLESFVKNLLISKYNLQKNYSKIKPNKKIKIAFLQERIIEYSINNVFYALLEHLSINKSSEYEFIIYDLNFIEFGGSDKQEVDKLKKLGFKYIDLHQECVGNDYIFYSQIDKVLKIRQQLIDDNIDILIGLNSRPEYNFLFTSRTATKQIYWSHGNDEYDLDSIDSKISMFNKIDKRFKFFEIIRDIHKYNPQVNMQEVSKIKASYPKDSFILGSIGRLVKLDSDEYLQTVASIMKKNPNTIYLACGAGDNSNIKNKVKALGISGRFFFTKYVNPHIYGHVIDLWLSPFPFGGGEALEEYRYKGKPYVTIYDYMPYIKEDDELKTMIIDLQKRTSTYYCNSFYSKNDLDNLSKYSYINPINKQAQSYFNLSFASDKNAYFTIANEFIKNKHLRDKSAAEFLYHMEARYNLEIDKNSFYNILKEIFDAK